MSNQPDSLSTPQRAFDPTTRGKLLPGIAGIAIFMLVITLLNVFGAMSNVFGAGSVKYGILTLCSFLVVGIFGLLKMKRWGWALVLGGCLLISLGNFYVFTRVHAGSALVQGLFMLVFFFYLSRAEVRDRLI